MHRRSVLYFVAVSWFIFLVLASLWLFVSTNRPFLIFMVETFHHNNQSSTIGSYTRAWGCETCEHNMKMRPEHCSAGIKRPLPRKPILVSEIEGVDET